MTKKNAQLRSRLLAQHPGLVELAPDDLEHILQVEEDLAELRATGVTPARLEARIAESRRLREEEANQPPRFTEEEEEAMWAQFLSEFEAESAELSGTPSGTAH